MTEIKANMAGSVWKITVKEGERISTGQDIVILESMKMEIPIASEASGQVIKLSVSEGDFVNEGDVLATIE
ncbi:acetyl-CoA carboxylase biotin carboxyl carrier protein subunit [Sediminibacillus albus]|uniref:Acetyl-CoA carboxylase biotin carboxyl carrier protein n=1 Tax=Sediminibacillus albus TaxID=407036 RepID=A0A1G8VWV6_9BACI|nr:acetyl-CoA carboxylase biotin carboxyl carrier protein subunit [Sediminibacillus albus]SDJ69965.1 acetyl-CoA carboxylase biotin carboxyl carrier protein [Sediminibacillus albus]